MTIFTLDITSSILIGMHLKAKCLKLGGFASASAWMISLLLAALLRTSRSIFNVKQEYTGLVSLDILAIFMIGLIWEKTTNRAVIWGVLCSIVFALGIKFLNRSGMLLVPWMNQMGWTFLFSCFVMVFFSH